MSARLSTGLSARLLGGHVGGSNYQQPLWMVAGMVLIAALLFSRIDASALCLPTHNSRRRLCDFLNACHDRSGVEQAVELTKIPQR